MSKLREFGVKLKSYRLKANEKIDDLADAMEIKSDQLKRLETGEEAPSLDILEMLISHFSLDDDEAMRFWELAGYGVEFEEEIKPMEDNNQQPKEVNVNMPADLRILYTDMVHVAGNNYGVVINFIQAGGASGKPTVVSRIGMSRDHAQSLIEVLQKGIENLDKQNK